MKLEQKIHLASHFFITLIFAIYYLISIDGWLRFVGFLAIIFFGWLIDIDHFFGNWGKCLRVLNELKSKKTATKLCNPNHVNIFHTLGFVQTMFVFLVLIGIFFMYILKNTSIALLIKLCFAVFTIHMIIDILNYETQIYPKVNPFSTYFHKLLWKYSWFRKICFNKPK